MKRPLLALALVVLALGAALGITYSIRDGTGTHTIRLTQSELEAVLRRRMPHTGQASSLIELTFDNPRVRLAPGTDRVGIDLDLSFALAVGSTRRSWGGHLEGNAGVRYDAASGRFFLRDPRVTELVLDGAESDTTRATEAAQTVLTTWLRSQPIYDVREHRSHAAARVLHEVRVEDAALVLVLGT